MPPNRHGRPEDRDQPLAWESIDWADPDRQWPIPHREWPAPDGFHDESVPTVVPPDCVETALATAAEWYPRLVGRRRDAVLLTFTDVFERYLAAALTDIGSDETTPGSDDHTQSELERW